MFDFGTPEGILNFIGFLIKIGILIEPAIVNAWKDWTDGKTTAAEAMAAADGKLAAMMAALADPKGDAAKLNAVEDAKLDAKFPPVK